MRTSALQAASAMLRAAQAGAATVAVTGAITVAVRVADGRVLRRTGPEAGAARPGSTMKPLTLVALLGEARFDAARRIGCPGRLRIAGRNFDCSHGAGVPAVNAVEALAFSCNRYFHYWSHLLTGEGLAGAMAGFGVKADVGGSAVQVAMQALGEWGVAVTPEGLAEAYRRLALRESEAALAPVFAGLREACVRGTARAAGREFAGKTGTAATESRLSLQAWFAGYTPAVRPQQVVVVYVPRGRGAVDAAPLARGALA